ncbi:uncharacterized protein LOC119728102 [Patiria miniata]|uniref:MARVEL domain-containing protein n=1 Tax=Patiria miniata TaxID=46514 RepID=A0A913ZWS8_PATMI|nr:uncharacterized protein LOC119728102 [Patiria miniata]
MADRSLLALVKIAVEVITLVVTLCTGIAVATTVGVTRAKIHLCILSVDVSCNSNYDFNDAAPSTCNYCLAIPIISVVLSPVIAAYRFFVYLKPNRGTGVITIVIVGGLALLSILWLVTAAIVSAGLASFCNQLGCYQPGADCRYLQNNIGWNDYYDGKSFYDMTKTAEAAAWVSFLFWTGLTVWCFVWDLIIRRRSPRQSSQAGKPTPVDVPI